MGNITKWFLKSVLLAFMFLSLGPIITAQISFTDVTKAAGIDHQFKVYEGMFGGGICVLDYNKDGFEDLYLTGGRNDDVLYENQGDGTFKNVFEGSGLEITRGYSTQGVAGADVNRDGWVDLMVTTITSTEEDLTIPRALNLLFLNQGDGTFKDATSAFGLGDMYSFSTAVSFGDFNKDGYPDAYIGNYFLDYDGPLTEISDATIVNASRTAEGYLLENVNGKYFKDVYTEYGLDHKGFGFGGLFTDYDNDGDQDLLINNDFGYKAKPNYLLRNNFPEKNFSYVEEEMGMDVRINAMTSAVGDYDNNGWLDYFITNIKFNRFMVNGGKGKPFVDMAKELNTYWFTISWGANFADFDHDGDLDLFVANGDLNPNCQPMVNFLFENRDTGFVETARASGVNDYGLGRGSVVFDIENDGDMDVIIVNQEAVKNYPVPSRTVLYRNDSIQGNWLKVQLIGNRSEPNGIGSRVKVYVKEVQMMREIDGGGSSHLSQNSTIAHFGIGAATQLDSVVVEWLGGEAQIFRNVNSNQLLSVRQLEDRIEATGIWKYAIGLLVGSLILLLILKKFNILL